MKYDILCVGDATLDIIMAGIPEDIFSRDSTLASTSKWLVGGDAANQACTWLAIPSTRCSLKVPLIYLI